MSWRPIPKSDPFALRMFARHYSASPNLSRRTIGPPGQSLTLRWHDRGLFHGVSQNYVRHRWPGHVMISVFRFERAESDPLASDLIVQACEITRSALDCDRFVTFVDPQKIRSEVPGACFRAARFRSDGRSKKGLVALMRHFHGTREAVSPQLALSYESV